MNGVDGKGRRTTGSQLVRCGFGRRLDILWIIVPPSNNNQGGEEVALVMELREVPSSGESQAFCDRLANLVRSAITQEHSLSISSIVFLRTKTVPKTTSGKIARAWCRKAYVGGTLHAVFEKSFKDEATNFEIETMKQSTPRAPLSSEDISKLRSASKEEILDKLRMDVARAGQIPPDTIDKDTALVTILDSLSITQFKGRLESGYGAKISDEYLFGESTTLTKLVEVVKLGYAPDDVGMDQANNSTWSEGDWNCDEEFDTSDIVAAFTDGGYELGGRLAVNAVPEPASCLTLIVGLIGIAVRRRCVSRSSGLPLLRSAG